MTIVALPAGPRLLVCGGRDYDDQEEMDRELDALHAEFGAKVLINGGQVTKEPRKPKLYGADWQATQWAQKKWPPIKVVYFFANWLRDGKAAGPIRNKRMLVEGRPDLVVAFKGEKGTRDMIRQAKAAKVPVRLLGKAWDQQTD